MTHTVTLLPAEELARANRAHYRQEDAAYRWARRSLPREEIELRQHIERLVAERHSLTPGGRIAKDFEFMAETGPVRLSSLFGEKDTLLVYSMMFGLRRKGPCPVCTSFLSSWNGTAVNLRECVSLVVTARSPIERLAEYKRQRGFTSLPFVSDGGGEYTRTYVNAEDADVPGFSVFTRRKGVIHHFYSGAMSDAVAEPEQDPEQDLLGAPDDDPLWLMLDATPGGRGTEWYPSYRVN